MSSYDYLTGNTAAIDPNDNVGKVRKPGGGRRGAGALNPGGGPAGSPPRSIQYPIGDLMKPDMIQIAQQQLQPPLKFPPISQPNSNRNIHQNYKGFQEPDRSSLSSQSTQKRGQEAPYDEQQGLIPESFGRPPSNQLAYRQEPELEELRNRGAISLLEEQHIPLSPSPSGGLPPLNRVVDFQKKMRDMEIQAIDQKGQFERKLTAITETLGAKFDRELKNILSKQLSTETYNNNNLQVASDQFQAFKKLTGNQMSQLGEILGGMQAKMSEVELKVGTMGRSVDNVRSVTQSARNDQVAQINPTNFVELETELKIMRQNMFDEKQKREMQANEHQVMITQVQQAVHQRENQILMQLKEAREGAFNALVTANDDRNLSEVRSREVGDTNMGLLKSMIDTIDRKIEDEISFRMQAEEANKLWFQQKLDVIAQGQRSDEQAALDREKNLMSQVQHGMAQISSIVKSLKDEQSQSNRDFIAQTSENVENAVNKVSQLADKITKKQQFLELTLTDLVSKMDTLQEQSIKHARMTNETLAKEVTRIEKVMSTLEQFTKHQVTELKNEIISVSQDTQKWQINFEDIQARKIIEVHQAIKVLNQNYLFMQKDAKDKFDLLQGQTQSNTDMVLTQVKEIKKHYTKQGSGVESSKEQPSYTRNEEVNTSLLIDAEARNEMTYKFGEQLKVLKKEMEMRAAEIAQRATKKVIEEKVQSDTLLEGRSQAFTVEVENKIQQQLNSFREQLSKTEKKREALYTERVEAMNQLMAEMSEKFQQKFSTHEAMKKEMNEQIDYVLKESTKDLNANFQGLVQQNAEMIESFHTRILEKGLLPPSDEEREDLQKLRDKTLYEYMSTLVNTAKIELETKFKHMGGGTASGGSPRRQTTIGDSNKQVKQLEDRLDQVKLSLQDRIKEEAATRQTDNDQMMQMIQKSSEGVKQTFTGRLQQLEQDVQNNEAGNKENKLSVIDLQARMTRMKQQTAQQLAKLGQNQAVAQQAQVQPGTVDSMPASALESTNEAIQTANDQINALNEQINALTEQINAANSELNITNQRIDQNVNEDKEFRLDVVQQIQDLAQDIQEPITKVSLVEVRQESHEKQLQSTNERIAIVEEQMLSMPSAQEIAQAKAEAGLPVEDNSQLSKRIDALETQQVLVQKQNTETNEMVQNFQRPFGEMREILNGITAHLNQNGNSFSSNIGDGEEQKVSSEAPKEIRLTEEKEMGDLE